MIPFSDYLILQEIGRIRPHFLEQIAKVADDMPSEGPPGKPPDQLPMPSDAKPKDDEDTEETDDSETEENDEDAEDTKTDLKMMQNCIRQIKNSQLKNVMRQFVDKLKQNPSKSPSQIDEPPATQVPKQQEPPLQMGAPMQDPNTQPGPTPAQGGGGM